MKEEHKDVWLIGIMLLLVAATVILAWWEVPEFSPVSVTYDAEISTTTQPPFIVSLNEADAYELMQLEGVGESTALNILAYREAVGGFTDIDELLEVEGIGEKKLELWRPYLTL